MTLSVKRTGAEASVPSAFLASTHTQTLCTELDTVNEAVRCCSLPFFKATAAIELLSAASVALQTPRGSLVNACSVIWWSVTVGGAAV